MFRMIQPWLASKVFFPAYHYMKRDGVLTAIDSLLQSQWTSPEEIRLLQFSKLRNLLNYSAEKVPYYRSLFRKLGFSTQDIVDVEGLCVIPPLTKEIIRNNMEKLCAEEIERTSLIANSTSGSTGEPMSFFNDRNSLVWRKAVVWRNQEWVGALYSDREVRLWGAQMDISKTESLRGRLHGLLHQKVFLSSYALSDESMQRYAAIIRRFKPKLLISYASPLVTFAEYLNRTGETLPLIPAIITSAETLYPLQREFIEKTFGTRIFDRYGCREFGNIAHQCEIHEGYHINAERFVVEIVDSTGKPVAEGDAGEILITDLDNFGFPFIRYRIGDMAVATTEQCRCGRGLPLIKRIEGRSFDIIQCPNGQRIAGTFWTIVMRRFPGVKKFQLVQDKPDHLIVRLCLSDEWTEGSKTEIVKKIRESCGDEMKVDLEVVENIELTRSGKSRIVINQVNA